MTLFQVRGDFKRTFNNKIYVFNFYSAKLCTHWRSGTLEVRPSWGEQNLCFYKIPAHIFKFLPRVITQTHFAPFGCIHLCKAIFKRIYRLCAVRVWGGGWRRRRGEWFLQMTHHITGRDTPVLSSLWAAALPHARVGCAKQESEAARACCVFTWCHIPSTHGRLRCAAINRAACFHLSSRAKLTTNVAALYFCLLRVLTKCFQEFKKEKKRKACKWLHGLMDFIHVQKNERKKKVKPAGTHVISLSFIL